MSLEITNLRAGVDSKEILKGVNLKVDSGEVVVLMGPNGSGKSSLANVLMGSPVYVQTEGVIKIDGEDVTNFSVDERAKRGLMMAFQYPVAIPGVTVRDLLLAVVRERGVGISALELKKKIEVVAGELGVSEELLERGLNEDFSGGEKKRLEVLQMRILEPKYIILDETDSGLDIDALKLVAEQVMDLVKKRKMGVLVITHYQRLLKHMNFDRVIVMKKGVIVNEGGEDLVDKLEIKGYSGI